MSQTLTKEILNQLRLLPAEEQRRVLDFTRALALTAPAGTPGKDLLRFAGSIGKEDLQRMSAAIEEGCEQVDPHEW